LNGLLITFMILNECLFGENEFQREKKNLQMQNMFLLFDAISFQQLLLCNKTVNYRDPATCKKDRLHSKKQKLCKTFNMSFVHVPFLEYC
jgi:hypothetical protein